MANPEHLAKLKEGVEAWNDWRKQNPETRPDLIEARLGECDLGGINLANACLTKASLRGANLIKADLSGALLSDANLRRANLSHAILRKTKLKLAYLHLASLTGADLSGADLTNAFLSEANLSKAKLTRTKLMLANLNMADLQKAKLGKAHLGGAKLIRARLVRANLRGAILRGADLTETVLRSSDLSGACLERAVLVRTDLEGATLSGCSVYGISAWDVNLAGTVQSNLVVTPEDQPLIQVDNLEVAQFVYLLLSRQKLRDVITTLGEKAVLILGRFTERKELLDRVAEKLRSLGYLPMIFDFERPTDRDLTETVKVLASLSRFVIADITNPRSVPLELQATVPDYMVPFVTILQRGEPAFGMFDDLPRRYHWALPLLEYNSVDTLLAALEQKVVNPALEKAQEVRLQKASAPVRRSAED
jgi:uncharacterized protein YjbI with pentapeptide repeats